jgi:hypothetical protein
VDIVLANAAHERFVALNALFQRHRQRPLDGLCCAVRVVGVDQQRFFQLFCGAGETRKHQHAGIGRVLRSNEFQLMIWWAQRLGVDGVAWSSLELQRTRWGAFALPEILYSKILPDAASSLAATLPIELDRTQLSVRSISRRVRFGKHGWEVRNRADTPVTKSFRTRAQAECFADLTGVFFYVDLPVLWICGLPPIKSIPLYGTEDAEAWFRRCERRNPLSEMSGDTESENCAS